MWKCLCVCVCFYIQYRPIHTRDPLCLASLEWRCLTTTRRNHLLNMFIAVNTFTCHHSHCHNPTLPLSRTNKATNPLSHANTHCHMPAPAVTCQHQQSHANTNCHMPTPAVSVTRHYSPCHTAKLPLSQANISTVTCQLLLLLSTTRTVMCQQSHWHAPTIPLSLTNTQSLTNTHCHTPTPTVTLQHSHCHIPKLTL